MKVLVLSDVHLKPWIFDRADRILTSGQADLAVQLGDLVDDWDQLKNVGLYNETMERAYKFHKAHPNTLWCLGNHDLAYYHHDYGPRESGHSALAEIDMYDWIVDLGAEGWHQETLHIVGCVAFSHAGLTHTWVERQKALTGAPVGLQDEELERLVNYAPLNELWLEDSPIWVRPQFDEMEMYGDYLHVVGHTPVPEPKQDKHRKLVSTDVFSTTSGHKPIGSQRFIIVDTETGEWHLAEEDYA